MHLKPAPIPAATKAGPWRILHLEDNSADRELVRQALVRDGFVCEYVYAAGKAEYVAALERERFDLILSDFSMAGYDGRAALALAQEKCAEVPFVFVSGTIGEERAIESLKSGATDYVLKNRLDRLFPAVQRALREAQERAGRRAAEESLARSEERFREMAERIDDVFHVCALDTGRWLYVSPAYEKIWGRSLAELYADPALWSAAIVPEDQPAVTAACERLAAGEEYCVEFRIKRPDGTERWLENRVYPILGADGKVQRAVGVAIDVTRHRLLEGQLLQAQKMEAVGQLSGGLAHDFNNVLTVVMGWARLLLDRGTMPADAIAPLTQIFNAGNRAANLTRQLLVFSRKQPVNRKVIDLNMVAGEITEMLHRVIGEHIRLEVLVDPAPCLAEADAGMIEQLLMNLAVNSRDAMSTGGTLTITTARVTYDEAAARRHPDARPGEFVCLTVRDTGCGIAAENLGRIFEPFFTTKGVGEGTGLGLAMVFGIVKQHQGWIELESAPGAGTCFRILLPATVQAASGGTAQPWKATAGGGSETVLLVEDDAAVREFAAAVLGGHGYRVLQAGSGAEALEVWKWHAPRIALLVTDLVLPDGLGGVELTARLRRDKPELRVVLASGYAKESIGEAFRPPAGTHFVQKPYKPQVLAQAVRDALDDHFNR